MSLIAAFGSTKVIGIMSPKQEKQISFDAFTNFAKNINEISNFKDVKAEKNNELKREELVINSVENELNQKIKIQKKLVAKINSDLIKTRNVKVSIINNKINEANRIKVNKEGQFKLESKNLNNNTEDLSKYEINNSEIVNIFAYKAERISFVKYDMPKSLFNFKKQSEDNKIEDNVSVKLASTLGPIEPEISKSVKDNDNNEDLKVYDYSEKNTEKTNLTTRKSVSTQKIDKELYERPLSETVKKVINREIGNKKTIGEYSPTIKKQILPNKEITPSNTEETEGDAKANNDEISLGSSGIEHDYNKEAMQAFIKPNDKVESFQNLNAKIKIIDINMSTHKNVQGSGFEFIPDYDRNERVYDNGIGELEFGYPSNSKTAITTGVINKSGSIPTRIELLMNNQETVVPSFGEVSYRNFLEANGIMKTNSIIVGLSEKIVDIDIDSDYEKRIYLDKDLKVTEANKKYILFAGIKSGNVLIKYKMNLGPISQKIIYIGEEEIYYEYPEFENIQRESFEIVSRSLMSTKNKELNTSASNLKIFNTNITSKKSALNVYELKFPQVPVGNRKYLELQYEGNSIFIGTREQAKIEIPQREFIEKVLTFNQISNLDQRCLVQINLSKEVSDIKANGKNLAGDMFVEMSVLDNEGKLNFENYENAEKIFLLGEQEGIMNAFINYTDGTSENLKTFCSNNTFLIEQL